MESMAGLEIMAAERTMSSLIGKLTGQPFVLLIMLTSHIQSYWKWNALINFHAVQLFRLLSVCNELLPVLQNFDLNPGWNATRNFVYNLRIETGIQVPALLVTKLRIFSLLLVTQWLFIRTSDRLREKDFTGFSGTDLRKNWPISREVVEIFGVKFTDKQQLKILNVDKTTSKWL